MSPLPGPVPGLKTFFCWVPKLGGDRATGNGGLYRAATRSKARYLCYLNVRDCYQDVRFQDIEVSRCRGYDEARFHDGHMPKYAEVAS